jgi:hypothetical protein
MMPFLPVAAYAETHYRFKYFFSWLKKAEPEILADIPHRVEPSAMLPVLLLVKDADTYPVDIITVVANIFHDTSFRSSVILHDTASAEAWRADAKFWWTISSIPFTGELAGLYGFFDVEIVIQYAIGGLVHECRNDNYRSASHRNYRVYRAAQPMPSFPDWRQGDAHTHSSYTDDQVEFGSPIPASVELCKAMGQSFFCVTDHSYDLDDCVDNYLKNDPALPKWHRLQGEVDAVNAADPSFAVIRGEEVSCGNSRGRNVHMLLYGARKFFHGSGDGAEHWFHTEPEHRIGEILDAMDEGTVAYAGHPSETTPLLQWLLIRRGTWTVDDMLHPHLSGIQILNGLFNGAFTRGLAVWKELLVAGRKVHIAGGNDAHGNFNSFRQIGIPFFTIREWDQQLFGRIRTGVFAPVASEEAILHSLRTGQSFITNGPVALAEIIDETGAAVGLGGTIDCAGATVRVRALSTEEYGSFTTIRILGTTETTDHEYTAHAFQCSGVYEFDERIDIPFPSGTGYLRIEASTENGMGLDAEGFCLTNPIWFTIQ